MIGQPCANLLRSDAIRHTLVKINADPIQAGKYMLLVSVMRLTVGFNVIREAAEPEASVPKIVWHFCAYATIIPPLVQQINCIASGPTLSRLNFPLTSRYRIHHTFEPSSRSHTPRIGFASSFRIWEHHPEQVSLAA
jgi:hypothetical protein